MTRPPYNEKYDYKAAHIAWATKNPTFESKQFSTMPAVKVNNYYLERPSYVETLKEWYLTSSNFIAYLNYYDDLQWLEDCQEIKKSLLVKPFETNVAHVAVGFNHQEFTVKKGFEFIQAVLNLGCVLDGSFAVMENFRENGIHPHVHMKIYWSGQLNKSQIIQAIFRARHGKKLVLGKNFIQFDNWIPETHDNYLNGIKKESKMKYVDMDREWRSKNSIPDQIFKDTVMK